MNTPSRKLSPGSKVFGARFHAVVRQLRTARCECGNFPKKKGGGYTDCYLVTAKIDDWCWPCRLRWSLRPDAAKFIAPMDDVVRTKVIS